MDKLKRRRELYQLNREKFLAKAKKWQKNNPEKVKETRKNWQKNNPNYKKDYFKKNPEKAKEQIFKSLMWRSKVKMTYTEFKEMLKGQNGKCVICGKVDRRRLSVDHCHKTGKVRGLLCHSCNVALGLFKDDIKLLKKAIIYLTK